MTEHNHPHPVDETPLTDQLIGQEIDPAGQSLAGALRTSFRLLSVIMVLLLGAYVVSGFETIDSGTRGVVLRFGRIVGADEAGHGKVLGEGIHFTWPFPIDELIVIAVDEQTLQLDSFWHYERPGQAALTEAEKTPVAEGLRPEYDGSLLTGDQGLVHVKWVVNYHVRREPYEVLNFVANVGDHVGAETGLLRSVIENASVQAAAGFPADDIARGSSAFTAASRTRAQRMLDDLGAGIEITSLTLADHTPPLQTLAAFREVTKAESMREQTINTARQQATSILRAAAGENWQPLHEAILAYERAMDEESPGDPYYERIVALLQDAQTTGQSREILASAGAQASATVSDARRAFEQYRELLQSYRQTPEFTISRLWMDTKQAVMADEMIAKLYVPTGIRTILWLKHDPSVWRTIRLRQAEETRERISTYAE